MKLATYRDGSRDGQLVVVSRDLALAHHASGIASRLQQLLDDWNFLSPQLEDLSATLNGGKARHAFPFDPARCMAPLPRAFQWALGRPDGAALHTLQFASDELLGAHEDACLSEPAGAPGLQAGFAVLTGDIPRGASAAQALERVRLVMLAHVWTLPGGAPAAGAFAPLAVTPDELGPAWRGGHLHLAIRQEPLAPGGSQPPSPPTDFGRLLETLASVRNVRAGSIVGPTLAPLATPAPVERLAPAAAGEEGPLARSEAMGADGLSVFGALAQCLAGARAAGRASP